MQGHVIKGLTKFQHPKPCQHQYAHTDGTDQHMAKGSNMHHHQTSQHNMMSRDSITFSLLLAPCCIMEEQSRIQF
eukprot:7693583-Ditylum_brightwellii.AAC.1